MNKYEYGLQTWGGFYNQEHQVKHKEQKGYKYFDTEEERDSYLEYLKHIEESTNAHYLMFNTFEGFCCRDVVTLHRISEYNGDQYHTKRELTPYYSYSAAKYMLEYKWYLGFNDYPLGKDFDYESENIKVIEEWISGNFAMEDED